MKKREGKRKEIMYKKSYVWKKYKGKRKQLDKKKYAYTMNGYRCLQQILTKMNPIIEAFNDSFLLCFTIHDQNDFKPPNEPSSLNGTND